MFLPLKTKIWMTVLSIVLMFTFFTLYYFPQQQGDFLLKNYNAEIQNLANTVALGVQIALKEDDFEGVQTAMNYVKGNADLKFVSLVQTDTSWNKQRTKFIIKETIFETYPDSIHPAVNIVSTDSLIVKKASFHTPLMSGGVLLAFTSNEINESKKNIRFTSLLVSGCIFLIGLVIGLWLSRNISVPVIKLRNAARRVGEGDLTQVIETSSNDEVGELTTAFNQMVKDILKTREELKSSYENLSVTNQILNNTLNDLRAMQSQLVQSEKMASLGAKEAKIEAALERVRGKAMAMHNSQDLADAIGVFYHELQSFSLTPRRCGVGLLDKEERIGELFTWNTTEQSESLELVGRLKMEGHPVLNEVYESWLTQTEYHPVLRGNEIKEYYNVLNPQMAFPDYNHDDVQFGYFFFFPEGSVYAWTEKKMQEDELQIYRRFTSVLSLTYKRYRDLQKAEINAKEAVKQAALDRIRAEIASMRTVNDLDKIIPLIWNELTILHIPFIRCGVFIMDDKRQLIRTFLSTPEGKAIAAFHIPYNTPGNIKHVLSHWHNKTIYINYWDTAAFTEFAHMLSKQGELTSPDQYLKTIPQGGFYLHFLPFLQGMLYVGNTTELNEDDIKLIQSVADAFSTAYARYEDFNKLEAAKQQVEKTLSELKQTQQQLIQSEKMASLGELTAGISHEIQNPLNFVNNFSEVSIELADELQDELNKVHLSETEKENIESIIKNLVQNQEKINQHGKRAAAIVKSMLLHSRVRTGQKEPTDINALTDEYLRLSYHGLRAKDKSFNAAISTDFDETIEKINVIPQDIGRVLLNLFNNAFYSVTAKKKTLNGDFEPALSVCTKKVNGKIEIHVKDNGRGVPQHVLDKIFQPFFTTKPPGEGTGLGLSLSYDIIKAHGGNINVMTKEDEGAEFVIELPIN